MDRYTSLLPNADLDKLHHLLQQKKQWLSQPKKGFLRYREPLEKIAHLRASTCSFSTDTVTIGKREDINQADHHQVLDCMRNLMPWRKGPFSVFGIDIDAEWRSERKWQRIVPELPDLKDTIIADIGCNNGYYMFRMAQHNPRYVLGFEPYVHHYYAFHTLNTFADQQNLNVELLGIEDLPLFPGCFDVIFCLGILYHRHSPIIALQDIHRALTTNGTVIIESQAIPGEQSMALFPEKTYAKVPGTWFVPTASCLQNWLERTGFKQVTLFCTHPMNSKEQRQTEWMSFESYEDFIDKNNPTLTIEGYPAPHRVFFKATK
ncbi:MAG: tRNA 5-methoxyuridine(34)/uridine 5-oxyacetic acid(34) synthase CmoB [Desulfobulbus propionicus]|nr:MAG: tRNA 5-methoxyuridine(34)/uridine 5-oxyacetic acid(34) synthase CmoB [Desulfobulbus propionicus]